MRRSFIAVLPMCLLISVINPLPAADPAATSPAPEPVQSRKIEVRGRRYQLKWEKNDLILWSSNLKDEDVQTQSVELVKEQGWQVSDCRLSPWLSQRGLIAIIRIRHKNGFRFFCFHLVARKPGTEVITANPRGDGRGPIYDTQEDWKVLSLDGNQSGDSFLAIIGEMNSDYREEKDAEGQPVYNNLIKRGVIIFNGCPMPPSPGGVTRFGP